MFTDKCSLHPLSRKLLFATENLGNFSYDCLNSHPTNVVQLHFNTLFLVLFNEISPQSFSFHCFPCLWL